MNKRDEERKKQAHLRMKDFLFLNELHSSKQIQIFAYNRFLEGAEWADQHPREGLWDAEKACQIIHEVINSDTIGQYLIFDDENIDFDSELFFDDLLRAMED